VPVDRKPADRFSSDKDQADASLKAQLEFILANVDRLQAIDQGRRMERAARSFKVLLDAGEDLTPRQRAYSESMYEQVMKVCGFQGVDRHIDKKRRGLKFG
jgi:hypothetical protein